MQKISFFGKISPIWLQRAKVEGKLGPLTVSQEEFLKINNRRNKNKH
jgi:hypothetical protein